ncbi:TonB-dependent receptor [Foetidibacter luteolus]|uniref:TonB-dependent receptor n=1 Tax=Foetidibacter luteolus TaxID=2608880 RepID=UPI00129AABC1|nr:TonB-dependent receptor [Foetidibacter luteolus]
MKVLAGILTACIVTLLCSFANAQTGRLTGYVKDNTKPVESATLSLLKLADSVLVKIAVTDKNGLFELDNVKAGDYLLKLEAIGYQKYFTAVKVKAGETTIVTEPVLQREEAALAGVSVTARRPLIENKIDKTVVNVDASPTNTGLSALEVLEKSPGVTVDNNGNISLKGKRGVIILIDGKPAYLSGEDLTNYLKNMSSNQLDQIEIMSQPSAKYDASGNSGVINIKTKKNRNNGFNGNISTSAIFARYFKNTNSINLNWRKDKVNIYGNYGYSYWEGFNEIYIDRSSRLNRNTAYDRYSSQYTFGKYSGRPQNFKAGIDWFANKKSTFGFAITGNFENDRFKSESRADIFDSLYHFVGYNQATSQTHDPWTNLGFNLNLQQKLDTAGKELNIDADYILYRTKGNQYSNNYLYDAKGVLLADSDPNNPNPYLLNGYLPANIDIYSFKADYKQPLKKGATLEAGVKFSYVKTDNDAQYTLYDNGAGKWKPDMQRSNHFLYKENINAAYINLQKQIKKFGIQLGLRAEQTVVDGNQVTRDTAFHRNYTRLFPTAYVSYNVNDKNTFGLSYGRRIERPNYQSLNPFQYQLDRYTYRQGNPNLQPQFSHNIELSYNYKGELNVSANFTTVSDIINDVLLTEKLPGDSNYTTYQTTLNVASSRNIGLSINYNKQLKKWWTLNVFANIYNNQFNGFLDGESINVNYTAFTANMSNQFNFNKGWSGEISGFYSSTQLETSSILARPMGMFSVGGGKKFLKDKAGIRLNLRDPFYIMSFRGSTDMNRGYTKIHSFWDNRRAIITFTYRFGSTNGQSPRRRSTGAEDVQNRVKSGGQN